MTRNNRFTFCRRALSFVREETGRICPPVAAASHSAGRFVQNASSKPGRRLLLPPSRLASLRGDVRKWPRTETAVWLTSAVCAPMSLVHLAMGAVAVLVDNDNQPRDCYDRMVE